MQSSFKRVLTRILFIGAAVLTGCGNNESDTSGGNGTNSGEGVLTVSIEENYSDYFEAIKGDFEEEHGVTVEFVFREQLEQAEALPLDGPADIGPDVMMIPYDRIGQLAQQGHLATVTIPDDGRFNETDIQQVTVDDQIYGMPYLLETLVLYYNKDLLDTEPTSFEDLEALMEDDQYNFEVESGMNTGFLANWLDFYYSYGLFAGYGGYIFGDDGTDPSDIGLNNEGSVEALNYLTEWYAKWPQGMLDEGTVGDFVDQSFIDGKTAAVINGPWGAANYEEGGVDFGVTTIPTLPNGENYQPFAGGRGWVISNYAKDVDLSQAWLEYITTHENQLEFYETVQQIPANIETRKVLLEEGTEVEAAVVEQYENANPMPNIPQTAEVWDNAKNMIFDTVSGNKSAKQSADDAVKVIQQLIEQKYE